MVSTFSSGSTFPSTNFQSMFDDSNSNDEFTFVDFLPERLSSAGLFRQAKYEKFRSTVNRANEWLRANPQWEIRSCESVEFEERNGVVKTERMIYAESNNFSIGFVRGLRLWISKTKTDISRSEQIDYLNMIPDLLKKGGTLTCPKFERIEDIINRYNRKIKMKPIPGRIISIETPVMQMRRRKKVDPEKTNWLEVKNMVQEYLFFLRIFFVVTEQTEIPPQEEIGIMDFMPNLKEKKGVFTLPKYDTFSNTFLKASDLCSRLTDRRICNVQTVMVNLKKDLKCRCRSKEYDTEQTYYMKNTSINTLFVKILRVSYFKNTFASKLEVNPTFPMTCKTFVPVLKSRSMFHSDFESLTETKARVSAWIKATGAQVMCAETLAIRLKDGGGRKDCSEASLTYRRSGFTEDWIFVLRVYMSGSFKEPPVEMLTHFQI